MSGSGYDDDSRKAAAELLARAQAGDKAAADQLSVAAHPGGWRPGHQNAAIDAYNQLTPGTDQDLKHINASHGFLGDWGEKIGSVLKVAAPIAGMVIPGLGTAGAMALGSLGSAAGGALHHDKFNLLKTLAAGGAAAAGNNALGNGLGGTSQSALDAATHMGPASSLSQQGGVMQSAGEASQPGFLGQLANQFKNPQGTVDFGKLTQVGGAGLGIMEKRAQRNSMERLYKTQANASAAQTGMAESAYAARKPYRDQAMSMLAPLQQSITSRGSR